MDKWVRANYQPNLPLEDGHYVTASAEHIALSLSAAEEGMVLLKNQNGLLPLTTGIKVALFGKGTFDYVKGGGGSGDVYTKYIRNLYDGIITAGAAEIYEPLADYYRENVSEQYKNGAAPGMTVEPELPDDLLKESREYSDTAIISISRFSGEGWDRSSVEYNAEYNPWPDENSMPKTAGRIFPRGDFYLTDAESSMISKVCECFDKVVAVLNIGGIIDTSWIKDDCKISSALLAWQGGMEGGLAAARILFGFVNPSGKLPDTFAATVDDYPSTALFHESPDYVDYTEDIYVGYRYFETIKGMKEKVCYPFGYGLSYTSFEMQMQSVESGVSSILFDICVKNTGNVAGKEVVQLYYSAPQGKLGKPAFELGDFVKTDLLLPGQTQIVQLHIDRNSLASFDDTGIIENAAYILEKGTYQFFYGAGTERLAKADFEIVLEEDEIVKKLESRLSPTSLEKRLCADGSYQNLPTAPANDPNACIFEKMVPGTEEGLAPEQKSRARHMLFDEILPNIHAFSEVADGKISLDEFMAQLSDDDLIHLLGGQPNNGVANTFGFGNLPEYGIPNIMTCDGPAGVRIQPVCGVKTTAWPCGTLLASTWNTDLVEAVGTAGGEEVKENNLAVWLTPAVNIHRNPLCGRNFEYYSEDPFLTGMTGAAMVRGIQKNNISACVKHFACNNKETNRKHSDSRVSERALREIYLKAFEIIVKTADPWAIMSSYNIINGQRASESHELLEDILRGEWGFKGVVTTDWWNRSEQYKEILAGNDVKMACGFPERVRKAMDMGAINRLDLEHCAKRVLELILKID